HQQQRGDDHFLESGRVEEVDSARIVGSFGAVHDAVFFSILPPHPRSTLFPYTTLFRSLLPQHRRHRDVRLRSRRARPQSRRQAADRKSTRLNSSHDQISYAVFCLKKKIAAGLRLKRSEARQCARIASSSSATMLVILIS